MAPLNKDPIVVGQGSYQLPNIFIRNDKGGLDFMDQQVINC